MADPDLTPSPPVDRSPCACPLLTRLAEPVVTARILVVGAHPDDETIGAGALLARSTDAQVVIVTDGAPADRRLWPAAVAAATREEYAAIRREELRLAVGEAGLGLERVHFFDVMDCEATAHISAIAARLGQLLDAIDPDIVLAPPYEGGHVDHDATALAVHAAMAIAGRGHPHEMALYHAAVSGIAVHDFLPADRPVHEARLTAALRTRKVRMLERYQSQQQHSMYFAAQVERFRCAPAYNFLESPTPGVPLLYERVNVAAGEEWRTRARAAIEALRLREPLAPPPPSSAAIGPDSRDERDLEPASASAAPLVSVIVRTVGRETLTETLDSIRCQTHPNIEIVLVVVSGPGAPASWESRPGLVLREQQAPGLDRPRAANAGLDAATGKYIAFLDDDDWYHPNHLASLVDGIRGTADARVAYTGVEVIEMRDDLPPRRRWLYDAPYDPLRLLCENYIPLNALVVDRALLDDGARFDDSMTVYEDWDFLIGLSRRSRFAKIPGIGAVYRWPPGSGVNDPQHTGPAQERVYRKWRAMLTAEEHVAIMRLAVTHTELNDTRTRDMQRLQEHLRAQDRELDILRPCVKAQEDQLERLRAHLAAQDEELARLRPQVSAHQAELEELRTHLNRQQQAFEAWRARAAAQERDLQQLRLEAAEKTAEIAAMRQSHSWRLTAPLRRLRVWMHTRSGGPRRRTS